MTLDDVKELCAEFGYVDNGGHDALRYWLRDRLKKPPQLEYEVQALRDRLDRAHHQNDEQRDRARHAEDQLHALKHAAENASAATGG